MPQSWSCQRYDRLTTGINPNVARFDCFWKNSTFSKSSFCEIYFKNSILKKHSFLNKTRLWKDRVLSKKLDSFKIEFLKKSSFLAKTSFWHKTRFWRNRVSVKKLESFKIEFLHPFLSKNRFWKKLDVQVFQKYFGKNWDPQLPQHHDAKFESSRPTGIPTYASRWHQIYYCPY